MLLCGFLHQSSPGIDHQMQPGEILAHLVKAAGEVVSGEDASFRFVQPLIGPANIFVARQKHEVCLITLMTSLDLEYIHANSSVADAMPLRAASITLPFAPKHSASGFNSLESVATLYSVLSQSTGQWHVVALRYTDVKLDSK